MAKSKKNKNKPKLNLTVREEQRNKLEQMASLENRSVSNLIEVMADERWERLVDPVGKSPEAQKQELAETMLEAHKALGKADPKNIRRFKPVRRFLKTRPSSRDNFEISWPLQCEVGNDSADQVRLAGAIRLMLLLVKVKEPLQGSQDYGSLSVIFAVLFRRFVRSKTKVLYRPDWQALRIMGKRSKVI